jgi:hypothetical protein
MGGVSVMIEIYSDRVEISSPGEPLVPVERFIDGYQSRNERLADLMRRVGICEGVAASIAWCRRQRAINCRHPISAQASGAPPR